LDNGDRSIVDALLVAKMRLPRIHGYAPSFYVLEVLDRRVLGHRIRLVCYVLASQVLDCSLSRAREVIEG
jgi:hypothetical protein